MLIPPWAPLIKEGREHITCPAFLLSFSNKKTNDNNYRESFVKIPIAPPLDPTLLKNISIYLPSLPLLVTSLNVSKVVGPGEAREVSRVIQLPTVNPEIMHLLRLGSLSTSLVLLGISFPQFTICCPGEGQPFPSSQ